MQRQLARVSGVARGELQARPAGHIALPQLHHQVGRVANQGFRHLDNRHLRHREPQPGRQLGSKQFVDQNAAMLRVILELDDVIAAVRAAQQVCLRPASHPADVLERVQH